MAAEVCDPNILGAKAGRLQVWGQIRIYSVTLSTKTIKSYESILLIVANNVIIVKLHEVHKKELTFSGLNLSILAGETETLPSTAFQSPHANMKT